MIRVTIRNDNKSASHTTRLDEELAQEETNGRISLLDEDAATALAISNALHTFLGGRSQCYLLAQALLSELDDAHGWPSLQKAADALLQAVKEFIKTTEDGRPSDSQCSVFSNSLMASWRSWEVLGKNELGLSMIPGDCTDMQGAIQAAKALMPDVQLIRTFSGRKSDTVYRKKADGTWEALIGEIANG